MGGAMRLRGRDSRAALDGRTVGLLVVGQLDVWTLGRGLEVFFSPQRRGGQDRTLWHWTGGSPSVEQQQRPRAPPAITAAARADWRATVTVSVAQLQRPAKIEPPLR